MSDNILNISFDGITFDPLDLENEDLVIGSGGNGKIYILKINGKDSNYVVKVLKKFTKPSLMKRRYARFIKEIELFYTYDEKELIDHAILPIVFPKKESLMKLNENRAYYVMPRAKIYKTVCAKYDLIDILNILGQILKALKFLHLHNTAHRDIKLDNILYYQNTWVLSDFGLVISEEDFKFERLTQEKEMVGPRGMPDELRYACKDKENDIETFKKSDIYLYGKLCWQLLTNNNYSFEGLLIPGSWAIRELQQSYSKYNCPILPLLEMMQRTICQLPEERENLDFIEKCLIKQKHLIDNHNNDELNLYYGKQNMFFNLYTIKSNGYFMDDNKHIMSLLETLKNIKIKIFKNNHMYNCLAKFTVLCLNVELECAIIAINNIFNGDVLFYFKPKRIESKDGCIQTIVVNDMSDFEKMNLRFQDERFDENKLLISNDYIEINCFGN